MEGPIARYPDTPEHTKRRMQGGKAVFAALNHKALLTRLSGANVVAEPRHLHVAL